jgi:hypothetical protein
VTTAKDFSVSLTLRLKSQTIITNLFDQPNVVQSRPKQNIGAQVKTRNRRDLRSCRSGRGSKKRGISCPQITSQTSPFDTCSVDFTKTKANCVARKH